MPLDEGDLEVWARKLRVKNHWEREVCASRYGVGVHGGFADLAARIDQRVYELDYMRAAFAEFERTRGKRVLEVGLGAGSDFIRWARAGAIAYGVDLTEASVSLVRRRLRVERLDAVVIVGDAERLPFPDEHFDIYYSWGVLHHTPDTEKALSEAWRVLKVGGRLKLMLYHYPSIFAWLVWGMYGPLRGRLVGPKQIICDRMESPGTKFFTVDEVRGMLDRATHGAPIQRRMQVQIYLASPDLLSFELSAKFRSWKWQILRQAYPSSLVKRLASDRFGTFMTVEVGKAA
jgi:SAM-dependent methyltransferase